jgi:hypothetical protein
MLEQQEIVVPGPADDFSLMDRPLQVPRLGIGEPTQPTGPK